MPTQKGLAHAAGRSIRRIGVLLVPDFALMSYACSVEPFRAANRLSGRDLYRWCHISLDGAPVPASNGVPIVAEHRVGHAPPLDLLVVCAGGNPAQFDDATTFGWLRHLASTGTYVAGISGGPFLLARAGLLDGHRCTIHWEHAPALAEAFPDLDLTGRLFEIDRGRLTCSGGTAALDMMAALIGEEHGAALSRAVADWFIHTSPRQADAPQRRPAGQRLAVGDPRLARVLEAMESALDEPIARERLAEVAGLSVRQLERLCRAQIGRSLGEHYRGLRLARARRLLAESDLSVLDIAVGCGFVSASHFARSYRAAFGRSPRAERHARG